MHDDPGTVKNWRLHTAGRRWQSFVVVGVSCIGIVVSAVLFLTLRAHETARIDRDLEQMALDRVSAVERTLELDSLNMEATRAFFQGSESVSRDEFATFVAILLNARPSILSMQWAPRVALADRAKFEEAAVRGGAADYRIAPYGHQSRRMALEPRDEAYPVLYSSPADDNAAILGRDLATNFACLDAIQRARDTGHLAATSKMLLTNYPGSPVGARLFLPVYDKNTVAQTIDERRAHIAGFIVIVLRLEGLLEESLAGFESQGVDICLTDSSSRGRNELLAWHRSRSPATSDQNARMAAPQEAAIFSKTIDVGGRRWTLAFTAAPHFVAARTTWYPAAAALATILVTALLVAYLIVIARYTSRTTRMATELAQMNQLMGNEVADRKRIEASLRTSQAKFKTLFDYSHDAILIRTLDRRCLSANATAVALFGCENEAELIALMPSGFYPEYQPDGSLSKVKAQEIVDKTIRDGSYRFEWTYKRKDGGEFLAMVCWTVLEMEGETYLQTTVRDITEQRRAEEALLASQKRFKALFDSSRDAIMIRTLDRRCLGANAAAVSLFGCKDEEELISLSPSDLYPEHQPDGSASDARADEIVSQFLVDGSYEVEWTYKRMDGTEFLAAVCWTKVQIENQTYLQTTIRDITEQKWLENMLRASEQRHRLFAENISEMIWILDLDGRFTYLSPSVEHAMGYPWGEDTGLTMAGLLTPSSQEIAQQALEEIVSGASAGLEAKPMTRELELVRKDGSTFWGEVTANRMYDDGGQFVGIVGVTHDISDRKKAEADRVLTTQRMESLLALNHMSDMPTEQITATVVEDAVSLTQSTIGYLALMNEDESVLTMQYWSKTAHASCKTIDQPIVYPVEKTGLWGESVRQRQPIVTNDYAAPSPFKRGTPEGHVALTRHVSIPVFEGDRIVAVAGVANKPTDYDERDVHQMQLLMDGWWRIVIHKRFEQQLAQARDEAEAANRAKSQFLANMSHEIRTPMTAILGYADLLMDPRINASSRSNYSAIIHRSGEHLLTLINDILDLSKIESGKFLLEMKRCSVVSMLAEVASLVRPRAESRNVAFSVEYAGEIPETILTDGARLRQAVINLVGNAVKFTERGSVRVRAAFLPSWRNNRPALTIDVIDTGIGIREEILPNLFQPFSQGESHVVQRFGGTGLGLAISRHIAEMLGGELTVTSVWGEGSTFTLTIPTGDLSGITMLQNPVELEQGGASPMWRATSKDLSGIRVLLAEDGFDNRELIQTILCAAGAEVETAENGRIAIEKAEASAFDLVLMDMNMPEMDGYEATRVLRAKGYAQPILALTANAMAGDSERCVEAGCNEHLAKPINRTQLVHTIAQYVHKEATGEASALRKDAEARSEGVIISEFINDPDMAEIIGGFVERLAGQLGAMREAFAGGQFDELRRLAHMLKGAGGSYGYPSLTDACKSLETAAKMHDKNAIDTALDTVAAMIRAIENGFSVSAPT